jgi:hypothetical protein
MYFMKRLLISCAIVFALASCRQYRFIHSASKINSPMLHEKGDSRINGSFSFGDAHSQQSDSAKNLGYDVQAAYAFTDHFAVMASAYARKEADVFDSTTKWVPFSFSYVNYNRTFYELGFGYYDRISDEFTFSVYGGMARGNLKILDNGRTKTAPYQREFSAQAWKYFVQPGFTFWKNLDLTMRMTVLQLRKINTNYTGDELQLLRLNNLSSSSQWLFEPSFTWQLPVQKWLKIETSVSCALHDSERNARLWNMSTGITLNPSMAFSKKKQEE